MAVNGFLAESITLDASQIIRVFGLAALSFLVAMLWTPILTNLLYKYRLGKHIRKTSATGDKAEFFYKYHQGKEGTPTMGGALIWIVTAVVTLLFNLTRQGTYLPLAVLVSTGIVGSIDDLLNVHGIGPSEGGFRFRDKFVIYTIIAGVGSWWFADKLGWLERGIHLPGLGDLVIGYWYIPLFILVLVGTAFAVNVTDGLDGLAGGLLAAAFGAYSIIALVQNQISLAIFCATIVGALLAFLWFNIYPARFFMGDTGSMALGTTLAVVAFLTNQFAVLPIIGGMFVIDGGSSVLQILSKRIFKRKIFLSAPIHHHFQAKGWPETKVTMRFWVVGAVFAAVGVVLALFGRTSLPLPF